MKVRDIINKYKNLPVQARALFWFLICSFLQKGISVITTPIFTRIMSPSEYGSFGAFNSWFNILTIVISMSLFQGVHVQGLVKYEEKRAVFSSSLLGLVTTSIFIWTVVYALFHEFWNSLLNLTTVQMSALLVMIWTFSVFNFWANEQRVKYSYKMLVAVTLIVSLAKPALEIILILSSDDKVTARILGIVIVELIGYSWMFVYQMKKGKKFFSKYFWKYALFFNLPLIPHYLSQVVLNSADRIMIKNMVGTDETGIYNLAYSLALIMTLFNTALLQTLNPWMYERIKKHEDKQMAKIAYTSLIAIALMNILIIVFAPEIVAIFAPKAYYEAIWVIPPVAMSVFFMFSYDLFAKHAFYYEKTIFVMIVSVIAAVLNIVLNFFFIDLFGYRAAGYTTLICFIIYAVLHYLYMRKVCRQYCSGEYPYDTKIILAIATVFIIIGFMFLATYNYQIIRYSIIALMMIMMILFRKRIINVVKQFAELRGNK